MARPTPSAASRGYRLLLRLYPLAFREEYGREMQQAFTHLWADTRTQRGWLGLSWVSLRLALDTVGSAAREHAAVLARDVRFAWRTLIRPTHRAFAVASITTLGLGIGATSAIFSLVHAVMLRPLPYAEPARLVRVYETNRALNIQSFTASIPNFLSWRERSRTLDGLAGLETVAGNLGDGTPERVEAVAVSRSFWSLTGLRAVAGRTFLAEEDRPGGPPVVLIGEGLWARRFGRDPGIVGRTLLFNERPHTVVGVAPQDVGFAADVDVWVPLAPDPGRNDRGNHQTLVVARLAPGITIAQAESELVGIGADLAREFPVSNDGWSVRLAPVETWIVGPGVRRTLLILFAAVATLLLVASLNVATLQVARATTRMREIGVRLALGASRAGLVRQLVTESLLLALAGGTLGLLLTWVAVVELDTLLPRSLPRIDAVGVTWPVAGFTLLVSLASVLVSGLAPGLAIARAEVQSALQSAGRTASAGRSRLRPALVAIQLTFATTLVFAAVLLFRSLTHLERQPLGFTPDGVITARLALTDLSEAAHERYSQTLVALIDDLGAQPGIASASLASDVPLGGNNTGMPVGPIPHPPTVPRDGIHASWRIVTRDYFATLRIPVLRGRTFNATDEVRQARVPLVVSAGLAARLWPDGRDPVGQTLWTANGHTSIVIGVVGDVRLRNLAEDPAPAMYFPMAFSLWPTMTLAVRSEGAPAAVVQTIRAAVARTMPRQPLYDVRPLASIVYTSAAEPRLNALLLALFAITALALAGVGIAGLTAYLVSQRTPELAVRLAIGATPGGLVRHVVLGGLRLCGAGIAGGVVLAWFSGQLLTGVVSGVEPGDPLALATAATTLLAAGTLACWIPARRASRIDPLTALRGD